MEKLESWSEAPSGSIGAIKEGEPSLHDAESDAVIALYSHTNDAERLLEQAKSAIENWKRNRSDDGP